MTTAAAKGILKHHFWGDYQATVALEFSSAEMAEAALSTLGEGWKSKGKYVAWFGGREALDALKARFAGMDLLVTCSDPRCRTKCRDQAIDGVPHSIDFGPAFVVSVPLPTPPEQLSILGGAS